MPRLRLIDSLSPGETDYLAELTALMDGHTYSRVSKATFLRFAESGDLVMWYEDTPLLTFQHDGVILNFDGWGSQSAIARANAFLAYLSCYVEKRGPDKSLFSYEHRGPDIVFRREEGDPDRLYLCEAGGIGHLITGPQFVPYTAQEHEDEDDGDDELDVANG